MAIYCYMFFHALNELCQEGKSHLCSTFASFNLADPCFTGVSCCLFVALWIFVKLWDLSGIFLLYFAGNNYPGTSPPSQQSLPIMPANTYPSNAPVSPLADKTNRYSSGSTASASSSGNWSNRGEQSRAQMSSYCDQLRNTDSTDM